ncbi:uncharacterized protein BP5553_01104 [Venustampulla echinocandica]|uniref:Smr domain-containing protein n=1 Tax=Venustampulla echinocandica TaxID=2656787 RepID=A0A370U030_9HELO|nr:uncharacterized protein BP5553_01104 [Venustampulla echinocandica]RDL41125.1 hypothetical protein BP5553_01104 [Venustampulla echinocandica]
MAASAYHMEQIGERAFNHSSNQSAEAEYDRLRGLAHQEAAKRGSCFDRSKKAYASNDGALAHQLSEEGKGHGAKMEEYNKQASDFIFRENNAPGRVADDTIDLHGQYVEEAERILEQRIRYARQTGQTHLHVITGKGNHSTNRVQKIKPAVERLCQELGLQYATEENAGRMYINLQGGSATMPPQNAWPSPGQHHGGQQQGGYPGAPQQHHQGGQQQGGQQQNNNDELEKLAKKLLPKVLKKLDGCCLVM